MTVILSHDAFFQRYGGVSRCVVELLRHLDGQGQDWHVAGGRFGSCLLEALRDEWPDRVDGTWSASGTGRIGASIRSEASFARLVARWPAAVVHRTYYPVLDMLPARVPVVVTLHDMYWEHRQTSRSLVSLVQSRIKRRALARANRIVCISEFTRAELTRLWPAYAVKAEVVYHGVSPLGPVCADAELKRQFLFVGERGDRKNFAAAVTGLARSGLHQHRLLCIGGGAFTPEQERLIAGAGLTGRVLQKAADDAELARCYAQSVALLYPSTYEGFGMPLLEAMLHNCPVIAARASCLPEIGGEAALYADPHDPAAWAAAMRDALEPDRRRRLIESGQRRAEQFSWVEVARRYAAIYRELAATLSRNHR